MEGWISRKKLTDALRVFFNGFREKGLQIFYGFREKGSRILYGFRKKLRCLV